LDSLLDKNIFDNTKILLTCDHGFEKNSKSHGKPSIDTSTILLLSNDYFLVESTPKIGFKRLCDITPTILDYFGLTKKEYVDIECESLMIKK
jgi:bisphosphoglycerate-independent phosphoglycerate mutase (AlkP superfamily)